MTDSREEGALIFISDSSVIIYNYVSYHVVMYNFIWKNMFDQLEIFLSSDKFYYKSFSISYFMKFNDASQIFIFSQGFDYGE